MFQIHWGYIYTLSGECVRCDRLLQLQVVSAERVAPAACPHPPIGKADSQDAWGQLLTAITLGQSPNFYLAPLGGASKGHLWRARRDVGGGGGGQGVGLQLHALSRRCFTIVTYDNYFHNPARRSCPGGLGPITLCTLCVCPLHPTSDPSTATSPPAIYNLVFQSGDLQLK